MKFAEEIKLELVSAPAEIYGKPSDEKYQQCEVLAKSMAEKIKK